jgi:cytochrome P450
MRRPDTPVRYSVRQLRSTLLDAQQQLANASGGFAKYQVLRRVVTLVASAEANRRIFVEMPGSYLRGRGYDNLALLLGRGLICAEGAVWQRQRRLVQPIFDKALMARVVEITAAFATQLTDDWDRARRHGDQVDLLADMHELAMRVIGMVLFGRDLRDDLRTDARGRATTTANCFTDAARYGPPVVFLRNISPIPLPLWLPTRLNRRFRGARVAVDRFVYERIDERLADRDGYDDILAELVRAYAEGGPRLSTRQLRAELRDQAVTLLFAGFETTAVALAWTWLLLSQNPDAEARFHDELKRVLGDRPAPAAEDLKSLVYTHQVVQESLRVYAPVYALTRTARADDELCGHQVRRGDTVMIPIHALHHMERYWDEPAAFCPERFAPGQLTEEQRAAYLPFSFGQRRCLGATFATVEMVTALAVAGQRVRLRHTDDSPVIPVPAVTQRPADGLRMRVESRSLPGGGVEDVVVALALAED